MHGTQAIASQRPCLLCTAAASCAYLRLHGMKSSAPVLSDITRDSSTMQPSMAALLPPVSLQISCKIRLASDVGPK
eukprot:1161220-Pelagomonas_calceolata.AAC.24